MKTNYVAEETVQLNNVSHQPKPSPNELGNLFINEESIDVAIESVIISAIIICTTPNNKYIFFIVSLFFRQMKLYLKCQLLHLLYLNPVIAILKLYPVKFQQGTWTKL